MHRDGNHGPLCFEVGLVDPGALALFDVAHQRCSFQEDLPASSTFDVLFVGMHLETMTFESSFALEVLATDGTGDVSLALHLMHMIGRIILKVQFTNLAIVVARHGRCLVLEEKTLGGKGFLAVGKGARKCSGWVDRGIRLRRWLASGSIHRGGIPRRGCGRGR